VHLVVSYCMEAVFLGGESTRYLVYTLSFLVVTEDYRLPSPPSNLHPAHFRSHFMLQHLLLRSSFRIFRL